MTDRFGRWFTLEQSDRHVLVPDRDTIFILEFNRQTQRTLEPFRAALWISNRQPEMTDCPKRERNLHTGNVNPSGEDANRRLPLRGSLANVSPGKVNDPAQMWQTLSTAHGNPACAVALYVARHYSDRTLRELAQLAGSMEYPAATMAIRRLERRLKLDKHLAKKVQRVLRLL
jgi:hypothetical protein